MVESWSRLGPGPGGVQSGHKRGEMRSPGPDMYAVFDDVLIREILLAEEGRYNYGQAQLEIQSLVSAKIQRK